MLLRVSIFLRHGLHMETMQGPPREVDARPHQQYEALIRGPVCPFFMDKVAMTRDLRLPRIHTYLLRIFHFYIWLFLVGHCGQPTIQSEHSRFLSSVRID